MKIGFISTFDQERIAFMSEHGFGCVELLARPDDPFIPGKNGWKDQAAKVKAAYDEAGIRISCLAGFYANHMDPTPKVAKQHHDHVRNCIQLAEHMGVSVVAGFAGRLVHEDLEKSIPKFKEIWTDHAKFAEDHNIKIAFEHCPMGQFHTPFGGINCICTPDMWDKCFDAVPSDALGLEWDPSHLICQFIDPVANVRHYGNKVFHVHAKDAKVYRDLLERYGPYHWGPIQHCFPGLGDTDWALVIKELLRAGYQNDLNIEGWHDWVYANHKDGPQQEDQGLLIALRHLSQFVDGK